VESPGAYSKQTSGSVTEQLVVAEGHRLPAVLKGLDRTGPHTTV